MEGEVSVLEDKESKNKWQVNPNSSSSIPDIKDQAIHSVCPVCLKFFSTKEEMMEHVSTQHAHSSGMGSSSLASSGIRVHECPQCKVLFNCSFDFSLHMCGHRKDVIVAQKTSDTVSFTNSGFECTVCGKMVGSRGNLAKHMFLHNGLKPYKCETCGKSFSIKGNRDKHMLTHSEERPHECHICQKKFTLKGNLQQHALTHMDKKLYKCVVCGKEFTLKGNLLKHLKRHENGMKMKNGDDVASWSVGEEERKSDETKEVVSAIINRLNETHRLQNERLEQLNEQALQIKVKCETSRNSIGEAKPASFYQGLTESNNVSDIKQEFSN